MHARSPRAAPYLALTTLCIGFFLIMMDTTIVNVAIPTISQELDASLDQAVWINSAYLLTYAVPLLLAGRLGDWLGRRPMFLGGMATFVVASLWCALAGSAPLLIAARAVQGMGAAAMTPQTMAFITALFNERRRGGPIGIWGGVGAVAAAAGPVAGGVLVDSGSWRWIFIVNVPIGLVGLLLGTLTLPVNRNPRAARADVFGAVVSGLGMLLLVFCLQDGARYGWGQVAGPLSIPVLLVASVSLLVVFVRRQHHAQLDPLMPLSLFVHRNFTAGAILVAAVSYALTGMSLPLTLYLQSQLGLSPLAAGLLVMPQAIAAGVVAPFAGRLSNGPDGSGRAAIVGGGIVFTIGLVLLAVTVGGTTELWLVATGTVLCGIGTGAVFSPLVNMALRGIPGTQIGSASGFYNTARQVGGVLGSATIGVLLQTQWGVRVTLLVLAVAPLAGVALWWAVAVARSPRPHVPGRELVEASGTTKE